MSDLLVVIAMLLMVVAAMVTSNSRGAPASSTQADVRSSQPSFLHKALGIGGIIVALGGFWIDWMLWVGLISIELGCIAYFVGKTHGVKRDDEST